MSEWRKIDTFFEYNNKGITPKYVDDSNIIVLNQKCIRDNKIDYSFARYTDDSISIKDKAFVEEGDILINSTGQGTAGRCAFVKKLPLDKRVVVDSHILRLKGKSYFESQCIAYSLFSIENLLQTFIDGSTGQGEFDKIRLFNLLSSIPIDRKKQQKIASTLSSLDDKIELNNRINAELEAIAKTLYDYWFVQFDFPNSNGKPYKSSGGEMVYNEELKREIPEGWIIKSIDFIGTIIGGSTPSTKKTENFTNDGIPWITPKDLSLNKNNKFISRGEIDVTSEGFKDASLNLMPRGTVLMSSRAPVGYLAIARNDVTTNQGFKSFVPKSYFTTEYIYYTIKNLMPAIEQNSSGSTFKEISASTLKTIKAPIPPERIIELYTNKIVSVFNKQESLEKENQYLASLRDWLLPMLMNGQVGFKKENKP